MSDLICPMCKKLWNNMDWDKSNPDCFKKIECGFCHNKWILQE